MRYRLMSGGIAVALAVAFPGSGAEQALAAAPTASRTASVGAAIGSAFVGSSKAALSGVARPEANALRTVDGRQTVVPQVGAAASGTPRPTPSGPVLYVDGAPGSGCSDTAGGAGTLGVPFCTLQAAANVVVAGDTVLVTPGVYAGFTLDAQGTAAAPITFESSVVSNDPGNSALIGIEALLPKGATSPAHAIDVENSNYVDLENFRIQELVTSDALLVNASHHVTVDEFMDWTAYGPHPQPAPDVHVSGDSSYVAITRASEFNGSRQPYVQVDAGGSNDTVADSAFWGDDATSVAVAGTPDTEITGNSLGGESTAVALTGNSPDSTVENNIVSVIDTNGSATPSVVVGTGSTSGTTLDYNVVRPNPSADYQWGTATYATAIALHKANSQGAHEINATPGISVGGNVLMLAYDSVGINAANAAAPGEQTTDIYGQSCVDDPSYPVTGAGSPAYCSRGSFQYQDPLSALVTATETGSMSVKADATASHGRDSVTSYSFDFGDGSVPVVNTSGLAAHTYQHSGDYPVTVTVTDSTGATNTSAATEVTTQGADFTALAPVRVLDTRNGTGSGSTAPVQAGGYVTFPVPASAASHGDLLQAVALNVTVTDATGSGYVGVSAGTSSLNYAAGHTVAAMVIAQVENDNGTLSVTLSDYGVGTVELIADMTGFFATDSTDGYQPLTPARVMDTRNGTGGSTGLLSSTEPDVLTVAGADGGAIPSSGVSAVAVNLTVTGTTGNGLVAAYPDGTAYSGTSSINYAAGQTLSNFAIIPVGADGKIDLASAGVGRTELIVDVVGYFDTAGGSGFVAADPYRDIDTRSGNPTVDCDTAKGALAPSGVLTAAAVCPKASSPAATALGNVTAVAVNTTVTAGTSTGYLTVYPAGVTTPGTSNLNWLHAGQTVANFTFAGSGKAGGVSFANRSGGTVQLVVDVYGYFVNS
jgi:PKD domain